jgi:serine/threonine-protein kinase
VWKPVFIRIVFRSNRADKATFNLYWQRADGTGEVQRLTESKNSQTPFSWHPNRKFLAFQEQSPNTGSDLMILPMEGDEASGWKPGKPTVFLSTPLPELCPMFSPDGRWLAYFSGEVGRNEVYVRPFPGPGGPWLISNGGGIEPMWSPTRPELFYGSGQNKDDGKIMVVPYTVEGNSFRAEKPRPSSEMRYLPRSRQDSFDLHPDGDRFALAVQDAQAGTKQDKVVFIFNFFDELRRVAPATR